LCLIAKEFAELIGDLFHMAIYLHIVLAINSIWRQIKRRLQLLQLVGHWFQLFQLAGFGLLQTIGWELMMKF
jgi:hypothetical protein